jgi:hypothetical protein
MKYNPIEMKSSISIPAIIHLNVELSGKLKITNASRKSLPNGYKIVLIKIHPAQINKKRPIAILGSKFIRNNIISF